MMFAMIRNDAELSWTDDATLRAGRSLTAALGDVAGFISCALIDTGAGGLVSIAVCEDSTGLDEIGRLLDDWFAEHLARPSRGSATVITGEVIVQRGL